jgi:pimeloyl-ACP methyl ester carboxylesterase
MWAFRKGQVADGGYAFANKRVEALLAPNTSKELVELARKGMRGVHPKEFLRGVHFIASNSHTPDKIGSKITMPVLQIAGTEDKVSPIALNAEPIKKALPNSKLEILQGIGHLPHLEAYKIVNQMIRDFFK